MKKLLLTLSIAIVSHYSSFAQWSNGMDIHNTTSGYVGIGTTNPESGFKLDVNGLGAIGTKGSARVYMGTTNATLAFIQSRDNSINQKLEFHASSYNFNLGNVGIGTTTPSSKLDILGDYADASLNANAPATLNLRTPGHVQVAINTQLAGPYTTSFQAKHSTANGLSYPIAFNPLGGNVGIGTTSPSQSLHIYGSAPKSQIQASSGNATYALFPSTGASGRVDFLNNAGAVKAIIASTDGTDAIDFYTNGTNNRMRIDANGNVGIGTANPLSKFDINGGVAIGSYAGSTTAPGNGLIISGNVGIGTTTPSTALEVWDSFLAGVPTFDARYQSIVRNSQNQIYVGVEGSSGGGIATGSLGGAGVVSSNSAKPLQLAANSAVAMTILEGGNILVGKTSQTNTAYKLDINGSARANEIVVNTTGADFVFEPDYKLLNLSEVKEFIDQNHHLPQIPSAQEMQKNGMNVGELNTKLLQKVEELTLYLIEKDKKDKEKDAQLRLQQSQIYQLKEQLTSVVKALTKN